ncbi:MAG: helix-turn-helix domain-containing protein [Candidatus Binatia bacterium]
MERITTLLRQAREARGVSLEEIETTTRIPMKYLQALEGTEKNGLLADEMYLIPFLRTYANFLGIDPNQAVTRFLAEVQHQEAMNTSMPERRMAVGGPRSTPSRLASWMFPFSLLLVGLFVGSYLWQHGLLQNLTTWWPSRLSSNEDANGPTPTTPSPPAIISPQSAPPVAVVPPPASSRSQTEPTPTGATLEGAPVEQSPVAVVPPSTQAGRPPITVESQPTTPREETAAPIPSPTTAATTTPSPTPTETSGHRLSIQAHEPTWMRVVVDNQKKVDVILQPGQTREWTAETGFTLSLGNAGGVVVNLDGRELPAIGQSGQVVRNLQLPQTQ